MPSLPSLSDVGLGGINPGTLAKEMIFPVVTAPFLAAKMGYKALDPLGLNKAKNNAKDQIDELARQQKDSAKSMAEALKRPPSPTQTASTYNAASRFDRLRLGLASTIKTRGGLSSPTLAAPSLTGSAKAKLGA